MKKYTVLSAIFGDYEILKEVENPSPDVEYVLVTDREDFVSDTWKIVRMYGGDKLSNYFYVKHHPWDFSDTDVVVFMDGSYKIKNDFTDYLVQPFIESKFEMYIPIHPSTKNLFQELCYWRYVRPNRMSDANFVNFINKLLYEFYNTDLVVCSCFYMVKRTNTIEKMFEELIKLQCELSIDEFYGDDQTVLSYILSTQYYDFDKIRFMNLNSMCNCNYFMWCEHGTEKSQDWAFGNVVKNNIAFDKTQELLIMK